MDDGGDWGEEQSSSGGALDRWMPLIAVFAAIMTFVAVLYFIFFAKASYQAAEITVGVVKHIASSEDRAIAGVIDQAQRQRRTALHAASKAQRTASKDVGEKLVNDLFAAAYNDFDPAKRDELARRLVQLGRDKAVFTSTVERALFDSGAHAILLEQKPTASRSWYRAAVLHEAWDQIAALSVTDDEVYSAAAAQAFCLAGETGKALGVYKWLIQQSTATMGRYVIAGAVACGATEDKLELELFEHPLTPLANVAAARNLPKLERQLKAKVRNLRTRMSVAARLYLAGSLSAEELVKESRNPQACWSDPSANGFLTERAPPEVLLDAADRLKNGKVKDKTAKQAAIENLQTAAILQGLGRGQDVRGDLDPKDWRNQSCMAVAEYMWEPEAAVARLEKLIGEFEKPKWEAHRQLAMAYARTGDFEKAFAEAQKVQALSKPRHGSRSDSNSLLIAFAHRAGKLDEVQLLDPYDHMRQLFDLLRGSDDDRLAYLRRNNNARGYGGPAPAAFYIRGALAPGYEEAFLDGIEDGNSSLGGHFWARAEAARWRGDVEAEAHWLARLKAAQERVAGGKFGGYYTLWTRL